MPALMQCVMNVLVCVYMFLEFLNDFFFKFVIFIQH